LLGRCHDMVDNLTVGMLEFGTLTIGTLWFVTSTYIAPFRQF
jgi:hypothetical protein